MRKQQMQQKNLKQEESAVAANTKYEAPAIEEVVTRDGLEREVAYAGIAPGPSQISN
jgi:hypothetical protein